jgi:hypothetical protein
MKGSNHVSTLLKTGFIGVQGKVNRQQWIWRSGKIVQSSTHPMENVNHASTKRFTTGEQRRGVSYIDPGRLWK